MSGHLIVHDPGVNSTLQDFGRSGAQRWGVPVSGALDCETFTLANLLVGNPPGTGALEALINGPTLEVAADSVRVALAGAGTFLEVRDDVGRGWRRVPAWCSTRLTRGARCRVAGLPETQCAYLAVQGGFAVAPVLGSVATYTRAGLGGWQGRAFARGDRLPLGSDAAEQRPERYLPNPPGAEKERPVRVVLGPQDDRFIPAAVERLLSSVYTVSTSADRMGMRLDGPRLQHKDGFDIVSDGIVAGAIQVPGSGQPIVLLADRQTTGGYPKIATVISADLPAIGRRRSGDTIQFTAVDRQQAATLARERRQWLDRLSRTIAPVQDPYQLSSETLYEQNLISGVVSTTTQVNRDG